MQTYGMAPEDLRMVYRTFAEVFPDVSLWYVNESDMVLVGTLQPQRLSYAGLRAALDGKPVAQQDLQALGLADPYSLLALYLMPKARLLEMAEGAELNLDDVPRLEFSAPRNLGRSTSALNMSLTRSFAVRPVVEDADPERDPGGHLALALAHGHRVARNWTEGLEWVDRALRLAPKSAEARLLRARLLIDDSRPVAASGELHKVLDLPSPPLAEVAEIAKLLQADDAVSVLRRVRERAPAFTEAQAALGEALVRNGEYEDAGRTYRALLARRPGDAAAWLGLGRALLWLKRYPEALAALDEAAARGERSGEYQAARGEVLMWLDRHGEAVAPFREALRTNIQNVTWRLNLGISLAQLGAREREEAEQRFREVVALDPGNTRAWEELNRLGKRL
jgi:tetratricopeptide (TPR) repeat protein